MQTNIAKKSAWAKTSRNFVFTRRQSLNKHGFFFFFKSITFFFLQFRFNNFMERVKKKVNIFRTAFTGFHYHVPF